MNKLAIFVLVLSVGVGFLIYRPLSVKTATFKLRLALAAWRIIFGVCKGQEVLVGLGTYYECLRGLTSLGRHISNTSDVKVTEEYFADVRSVLYQPVSANKEDGKGRAALVYLHGGGWVFGIPEALHTVNLDLVRRLNIVIVGFDYRKAPEHPYPTPFDDCLAGILSFAESAAKYGVDPKRIAVYGDSAGGNLATAVAGLLHSGGVPESKFRIAQLILFYPALQTLDFSLPSYHENANEELLTRDLMFFYWQLYVTGNLNMTSHLRVNNHTNSALRKKAKEHIWNHLPNSPTPPPGQGPGDPEAIKAMESATTDPLVSPILFSDPALRKLPPVYIATSEYDVLRDEGIAFARRLHKLKHQVTHEHYYFYHPFLFFYDVKAPECLFAIDDLVKYLRKHL